MVNLLREIDPTVSLGRETTLASQFDQALLVMKVFGGIIGALAASALFLSIIGIYGVVAFGVAQRTHEIGIRIALGGTASTVLRMIAGEAFRFVALGVIIGLAVAAALGRVMKTLLFGVSALDPLTYAIVAIVFGVVAFVACVVPARRVTRVDPLVALRAD
jgi:putative ABC transport system permease protein